MVVNVAAIIVLVIFYLIILAIGVIAAWKVKVKGHENGGLEVSLVAGRDLNTFVGIITMIATAVGGGYVNGTAEEVARNGLIWTLAPLGIFLGLNIAGAFYARKMRERQYLTMLDPFQVHYGKVVVCLIYCASLMGDLLWTASILNALGTTLSVIANIQIVVAVVVSGAITILYTAVGSIIAVAYTDIVQLAFIFVGLFLSLPFIFTNDKIGDITQTKDTWIGEVPSQSWGVWTDLLIAMTFGSIPWQTYFQRVLSVRSARQAQVLSCVGALGALVLVVPSVLIGMAGTSADWSNTTYGQSPIGTDKASLILPLVINEFTPKPVAILGLGAISAAVMSSADSSVLATSSMFTRNIYGEIVRPCASKKELNLVRIASVACFGSISIVIALTSTVIYGMFILAADIVFVIVYPQLTAVLYCPQYTNSIGSVAGFFTGLLLRIGAGEPFLHIPAWIKFFFYDDSDGQLFPHRSVAMVCSFCVTVLISKLSMFILNLYENDNCSGDRFGGVRCGGWLDIFRWRKSRRKLYECRDESIVGKIDREEEGEEIEEVEKDCDSGNIIVGTKMNGCNNKNGCRLNGVKNSQSGNMDKEGGGRGGEGEDGGINRFVGTAKRRQGGKGGSELETGQILVNSEEAVTKI